MKKKKMSAGKIAALSGAALIGLGALMGGGGDKDPEPAAEPVRTVTAAPADPTAVPTATPEPTPTPYRIHYHDAYTTVYVSKNGVIHFTPDCSGMKNYTEMSLEDADAAGYEYCTRCG